MVSAGCLLGLDYSGYAVVNDSPRKGSAAAAMRIERPRSLQIIEQQLLLNILIIVASEAILASQLPTLEAGELKNRRIELLLVFFLIHHTPPNLWCWWMSQNVSSLWRHALGWCHPQGFR
jgi:hypothetical protein